LKTTLKHILGLIIIGINTFSFTDATAQTCDAQVTLIDERLSFNDLENFRTHVQCYVNLHEDPDVEIGIYTDDKPKDLPIAPDASDVLFESLMPFYDQGFISLRPPITEKYQSYIYEKLRETYQGALSEHESLDKILDRFEKIIGHDVLASMLNQQAEVQIADKIYKYTDIGLFEVDASQYPYLLEFMSSQRISADLLVDTDRTMGRAFLQTHASEDGSLTSLGNGTIKYFALKQ